METVEAIITRRSVRHFLSQPVPPEMVETLLKAAMQAPSAANAQPWHFIIITDRDSLEQVTTFHPAAESLHEAPMAILVCGDDKMEKRPDRWILDCSAASQNILLAAHALGLGAVWVGIQPDEIRITGMRQITRLPAHIHPLSLIAVGFPARVPPPVNRFHPERIHYNRWE
ncbi:MAG: nitroreductase family protein [Anaerolineaceae bacterium]|nr:nitroreductase family protein [Anaerolineaceae bacterium]